MLGAGSRARRAAEAGQRVEGQVDLEARAAEVEGLEPARDLVGKRVAPDEAQERPLGIGARDHRAGLDRLPVLEHHTDRPPIPQHDARHRRLAPDLRALRPRGLRQRLAERAHTPLDVGPDTARAARLTHHVVEEHVARTGRGGRGPGPDHRIGGKRPQQGLALEPALESRPRSPQQESAGPRQIPAQAEEAEPEPREKAQIASLEPRGIRRRRVEQGLEAARHAIEKGLVSRITLRVMRREARDGAPRGLRIRAQQEPPTIRQRCVRGRIAPQQPQPPAVEVQLSKKRRSQEAGHVGRARDPEARPELLGHTRPAQQRAPLQQQRAQPRPRQVGCCHQPVVPAPDHNYVAIHDETLYTSAPWGRWRSRRWTSSVW